MKIATKVTKMVKNNGEFVTVEGRYELSREMALGRKQQKQTGNARLYKRMNDWGYSSGLGGDMVNVVSILGDDTYTRAIHNFVGEILIGVCRKVAYETLTKRIRDVIREGTDMPYRKPKDHWMENPSIFQLEDILPLLNIGNGPLRILAGQKS